VHHLSTHLLFVIYDNCILPSSIHVAPSASYSFSGERRSISNVARLVDSVVYYERKIAL
jgi:hypothetical protein